MDKRAVERATALVLKAIGEDTEREGLADTPARVAALYERLFSGVGHDPASVFKGYTVENHDEMVLLKGIEFISVCEHHLLPFYGKAHLAYIPEGGRITGFSNFLEVLELFAHRPQIQERLTSQLVDFLNRSLRPMGILGVVEATHLCMMLAEHGSRGVRVVTSAMRGYLRRPAPRAEALKLMGLDLSH